MNVKKITMFIKKLKNNKAIISNFKYMTLVNLANVVIPLITYPYLLKVLGMEKYGQIVLIQGTLALLSVFINYGFELSGVKRIAENKEDKIKVNEIIANVYAVKFIIFTFVMVFFILWGFYSTNNFVLIISFSGVLFYYWLYPLWFFQGVEKMKPIALLNLAQKILTLLLIFFYVKDETDNVTLACIYSTTCIFVSVIGVALLFSFENNKIVKVTRNSLMEYFFCGFDLFYSNLFVSVKDKLSLILVGVLFSPSFVILYDIGLKIANVLSIPIGVLNNVAFPKIAREKSKIGFLGILVINFIYAVCFSILFFFIIYYVDLEEYSIRNGDKLYICIFLVIPVITSLSQTIMRNFLNAFGFRREYLFSITLTTAFYFLSIAIFWFLPGKSYAQFLIVIISTFMFELTIRSYFCAKKINKC